MEGAIEAVIRHFGFHLEQSHGASCVAPFVEQSMECAEICGLPSLTNPGRLGAWLDAGHDVPPYTAAAQLDYK